MMGALGRWLAAVIAASLVCALAAALMPQGGVKRVGRLVCGLVLLAVMLSPLQTLDLSESQRWLEAYLDSLERRETELSQTLNEQMKPIIEEEYAAYILDKAAQMGLTCTVRVECREGEEGLYLPARTQVTGPLSPEEQAGLSRIIETDLGVMAEDQSFIKEDVP